MVFTIFDQYGIIGARYKGGTVIPHNLEKRGGGRNDIDGSVDASYFVVLGCLWCSQFDTKEITIP